MNATDSSRLHVLARKAQDNVSDLDLARAYLRYEKLRTLSPVKFVKLWDAALTGNFDDEVDKLILSDSTP